MVISRRWCGTLNRVACNFQEGGDLLLCDGRIAGCPCPKMVHKLLISLLPVPIQVFYCIYLIMFELFIPQYHPACLNLKNVPKGRY